MKSQPHFIIWEEGILWWLLSKHFLYHLENTTCETHIVAVFEDYIVHQLILRPIIECSIWCLCNSIILLIKHDLHLLSFLVKLSNRCGNPCFLTVSNASKQRLMNRYHPSFSQRWFHNPEDWRPSTVRRNRSSLQIQELCLNLFVSFFCNKPWCDSLEMTERTIQCVKWNWQQAAIVAYDSKQPL